MGIQTIREKIAAFYEKIRIFLPHETDGSVVCLHIDTKEIRVFDGNIEHIIQTPENSVLDGVIVNPHAVAGAIKRLLKAQGIVNENVVTAVNGKYVILHLTTVPPVAPQRIKEIIKEEASKYIIFGGEDLLTDFYPLEEISEGSNKQLKVLSVIVKKEVIDSYVETIKLAKLNLQGIDEDSLSLLRSIHSLEPFSQGIIELVVVKNDSAVIFLFKEGKLSFLHNVDSLEELNTEIEDIKNFCKNQIEEKEKIKIIKSTALQDVSIVKGLARSVGGKTDFPIKINLLPLEEIQIKEFNCQVARFVKYLGLLTGILILYFSFLQFQIWLTFRNIVFIQDDFNKPNLILNKLLDLEKRGKLYGLEIQRQKEIMINERGGNWGGILKEIKLIIPKKAYLMSMTSDDKNGVSFKGKAVNQNAVFDFVRSLKGSNYFRDVRLEESRDENTGNVTGAYFAIKCLLKKENNGDVQNY